MYPSHESYWDIYKDRFVRIASSMGQAQFMLTEYIHRAKNNPNEWLLLCRFADTVPPWEGKSELRDLRRFAEHLKNSCFESLYGHVNPIVAIEAEKEIILRTAPDYAEGLGHDIAPAARLLKDYERNSPVFTQAERNLILTYAYFMGDAPGTEQIASRMAAHDFSSRDIAIVCASIEAVNLSWSGLEQMEGIEVGIEEYPTFRFSFENCEDPMKIYPRFALYPTVFPHGDELLQSGVVIRPCPGDPGRWQSDLWKIDQTYAAPRYYVKADRGRYKMAEYVDVDSPRDLEALVCKGCTVPPQPEGVSILPKPSIQRKLRVAEQEVRQRPPQKGKIKDDGAR